MGYFDNKDWTQFWGDYYGDKKGAADYHERGMDEFGFTDQQPHHLFALDTQLRADRRAETRNQQMVDSALGVQREGLSNLQSYRPGGAAALTSGYYANLSNLYLQKQTDAPDLLAGWREAKQLDADRQQKKMIQRMTMQPWANAGAAAATSFQQRGEADRETANKATEERTIGGGTSENPVVAQGQGAAPAKMAGGGSPAEAPAGTPAPGASPGAGGHHPVPGGGQAAPARMDGGGAPAGPAGGSPPAGGGGAAPGGAPGAPAGGGGGAPGGGGGGPGGFGGGGVGPEGSVGGADWTSMIAGRSGDPYGAMAYTPEAAADSLGAPEKPAMDAANEVAASSAIGGTPYLDRAHLVMDQQLLALDFLGEDFSDIS